ncbi:hypothetical protein JA1_003566 [Spathaspora sp. JA1]|nr:hypothetical protein JA1_003566 [Spathaspora sp. JA1]
MTTQLTIMSLPDHILSDILNNLNQIHVYRVCTVNRRLYTLGKARLYHSLYFFDSLSASLLISPMLYTSFYTKFTVVNNWFSFPWGQENSNIGFVKRMVFRVSGARLEVTRSLYPWIHTTVEKECTDYNLTCTEQSYKSTHLLLSKKNKIPCQSQASFPWVNKLTLYMESVDEDDLPAIAKLSGLTDLIIHCKHVRLSKLARIGLDSLAIKKLQISFDGTDELISIHSIQNIFALEKIITFQLHFLDVEKYPVDLNEQIRTLLSRLPNMQNLSLITPNIDFDHVLDILKPNSLHALYLKIIQAEDGNEELQVEKALQNQELSLKRLYLSSRKDLHETIQNYGFIEFERIMVLDGRDYEEESVEDIARIRNILQDGKRFHQLYQVLWNENCYFIKRNNNNIYINPSILYEYYNRVADEE